MKAVVFGAGGQVGRAVLAQTPEGCRSRGFALADVDIVDWPCVTGALEREHPAVVFNCAAYTAVDRAEIEPERAQAVNADAVRHMKAATDRVGALLVHISTDFVFDGSAGRAYQPSAERSPLSVYGRTKAAGEDAAGPDALIVRSSWVYASGTDNFVSAVLRLMREQGRLRVVVDQIGSPTWASGLAKTLWSLASKDVRGIHHFSDAGVASRYDFAVAIAEEGQRLGLLHRMPLIQPTTTRENGGRAERPPFSVLDTRATANLLGREPIHWRDNLRRMLAEEALLWPGS